MKNMDDEEVRRALNTIEALAHATDIPEDRRSSLLRTATSLRRALTGMTPLQWMAVEQQEQESISDKTNQGGYMACFYRARFDHDGSQMARDPTDSQRVGGGLDDEGRTR